MSNLKEIVSQVHKVTVVMGEIAVASEQQQQGVEQLNMAATQLNQVTQQTAANSEEAASTAEELSSQSAEMQHMVRNFKLSQTVASTQPAHRTRAVEYPTPVVAKVGTLEPTLSPAPVNGAPGTVYGTQIA